MKKIFGLLTTFLLLSNCVESMALLAPVSTATGSGNLAHSAVSSALSLGVKQQTGKSPTEHAIAYVKSNNPSNKKEKCLDFIEGDHMPWEDKPIQQITSQGQLMAFEHRGFWQPMDTLREKNLLQSLWGGGKAPWKKWE